MNHCTSLLLAASTAAALAAWSPARAATAPTNLETLRDLLKARQDTLAELRASARLECDLAAIALNNFFIVQPSVGDALKAPALQAVQSREACRRATTAADDADKAAKLAWDALGNAVAAPAAPLPLLLGVGEIIQKAALAQSRVDQARSDYADPYESGDAASKKVLDAKNLNKEDLKAHTKHAREARDSAAKVSRAVRAAQSASNRLVREALVLKECHPTCTELSVQQAASRAQAQLIESLDTAKSEFELGKQAALFASVGVEYPNNAAAQKNAIAFARLIDVFPDARSALGEASVFGLTANGTNTVATIKLGGANVLPFGWRQTSFTLSAPLDSKDNPRLYTRGAGFNDAAVLGGSTYWFFGGKVGSLLADKNYLTAGGVRGSVGLGGKLKYRGDDLKERDAERLFREGSVGGYFTLFTQSRNDKNQAVADPGVHLLSADLKRAMSRGTESTRCPAQPTGANPYLVCVSGYFTPPSFKYSRLIGYEYRWQTADWAIAPKVQYEDVTDQTTVRLPYYFIRSSDPAAKKSFSAGLELLWTRGRADDGRRVTDRTLGVFVGLPLSFGVPSRE